MILSSSPFLCSRFFSLLPIDFFTFSSCSLFSACSSVASLMCFSASFISSPCISISLLMASNSRLFFTFSLCFSYFFNNACDSLMASLRPSINSWIPLISSSTRVNLLCRPSNSSSRSFTSSGNSPLRI